MIQDLCRLCARKSLNMLDIFGNTANERQILVKIEEALSVVVNQNDRLPKSICFPCCDRLEYVYRFIDFCRNVQKQLEELLEENVGGKNVEGLEEKSHTLHEFLQCKLDIVESFMKGNNTLDKMHYNKNSGNDDKCFTEDDGVSSVFENTGYEKFKKRILLDNLKTHVDEYHDDDHYLESSVISDDGIERNVNDSDFEKVPAVHDKVANVTTRSRKERKRIGTRNTVLKCPRTRKQNLESNETSTCLTVSKKDDDMIFSESISNSSKTRQGAVNRQNERSLKIQKSHETDTPTKLSCTACPKTFVHPSTYEEHLNVHTGNRPFRCRLCDASFRKRQELNQHARTIHSAKRLQCALCDHVAKHKGKLTEHMKSVHEKPFACDTCNYRAGEKSKIVQHIANKHGGEYAFVCEICGNGFRTKPSLQTHRQNIHFPEPKVCQICGMMCPSLARYSAHIFRCGKEKRRFPCDKCGKTYVNKEILKDHMNKHLNLRPYKCDICGKEFYQRNRLDTHKYVHRGANYKCGVCNQSFKRKDNMKNHMKKHFYKPVQCENMIFTVV